MRKNYDKVFCERKWSKKVLSSIQKRLSPSTISAYIRSRDESRLQEEFSRSKGNVSFFSDGVNDKDDLLVSSHRKQNCYRSELHRSWSSVWSWFCVRHYSPHSRNSNILPTKTASLQCRWRADRIWHVWWVSISNGIGGESCLGPRGFGFSQVDCGKKAGPSFSC